MPFNKVDRVINEKIECLTNSRHKMFNTRRTQDAKGTWVRHLGSHHQKTWNAEAVVSVKMTDSDHPKRFDSQFRPLEIDLAAFSSIENIELTLKAYNKGGEKPIRERHHTSGSEKYAVHLVPQPTLTLLLPLLFEWLIS
jgi:hypothetical protein